MRAQHLQVTNGKQTSELGRKSAFLTITQHACKQAFAIRQADVIATLHYQSLKHFSRI